MALSQSLNFQSILYGGCKLTSKDQLHFFYLFKNINKKTRYIVFDFLLTSLGHI